MSEIEGLVRSYQQRVREPWPRAVAGPERVWLAIYEPSQERRLRPRVGAFENETLAAGHGWRLLDLTDAFAAWMAQHEYREAYFESPEDIEPALDEFAASVIARVTDALTAPDVDEHTVVAVLGVGALFGLMKVSVLLEQVAPTIRGRLLVFFPGHHEGSNYRLLDARDGWNYLAVPITATNGS